MQRKVVVKIGTSSITSPSGAVDREVIEGLVGQVVQLRSAGIETVIVTSGAITAGLPAMGLDPDQRPGDVVTLQAVSAVGQIQLMNRWSEAFAHHDLVVGQVLLSPLDFTLRRQYVHARSTLARMLELGVVPVANENDTLADDEIRYGDNDRLAALIAHVIDAELLVLLTDTPGVLTADPRVDSTASLIEEVGQADADLEAAIGGAGSVRGSGGMGSKLAAARMAAWSGVRAVIAAAGRPDVLAEAVEGTSGVGTQVAPRSAVVPARKLWIAFAAPPVGRIRIDPGAVEAIVDGKRSLLPAGVVEVLAPWSLDEAIEVFDQNHQLVAKGLARMDSETLETIRGVSLAERPPGSSSSLIHRDDLVVLDT